MSTTHTFQTRFGSEAQIDLPAREGLVDACGGFVEGFQKSKNIGFALDRARRTFREAQGFTGGEEAEVRGALVICEFARLWLEEPNRRFEHLIGLVDWTPEQWVQEVMPKARPFYQNFILSSVNDMVAKGWTLSSLRMNVYGEVFANFHRPCQPGETSTVTRNGESVMVEFLSFR